MKKQHTGLTLYDPLSYANNYKEVNNLIKDLQ